MRLTTSLPVHSNSLGACTNELHHMPNDRDVQLFECLCSEQDSVSVTWNSKREFCEVIATLHKSTITIPSRLLIIGCMKCHWIKYFVGDWPTIGEHQFILNGLQSTPWIVVYSYWCRMKCWERRFLTMGDQLMWRTGTMKTKLRRRWWHDEDVKEDEDQYKRTDMKMRMTVTEIDYMSVMIYKILLWLNWCHHHHQPDAHTQGPFKYIHIHFGRAGWKHNLSKQYQQFTIMIVSKLSTAISQTSNSTVGTHASFETYIDWMITPPSERV